MIYTAIDKLIQALFDKKTVKTECKTIINKERKEKSEYVPCEEKTSLYEFFKDMEGLRKVSGCSVSRGRRESLKSAGFGRSRDFFRDSLLNSRG